MKTKLTRIFITDKNISKGPLIDKNGHPFYKVSIKTEHHGDAWIAKNYVPPREIGMIRDWKEGDEVDLDFFQITHNGKEYTNWRFPRVDRKPPVVNDRVARLEKRIEKIERHLNLSEETEFLNLQATDEGFEDYSEPNF